ncbi:hypothetical protein RRG08_023203 [Elysia crispata]|uniref:Uncharacterized protein n=1 Tax=Elysia crispata TaxID=231223 RepID=A0AAE0ZQ40_9GAST|nr:hypothetical protein RRG08_023203 [Elysia crispata]
MFGFPSLDLTLADWYCQKMKSTKYPLVIWSIFTDSFMPRRNEKDFKLSINEDYDAFLTQSVLRRISSSRSMRIVTHFSLNHNEKDLKLSINEDCDAFLTQSVMRRISSSRSMRIVTHFSLNHNEKDLKLSPNEDCDAFLTQSVMRRISSSHPIGLCRISHSISNEKDLKLSPNRTVSHLSLNHRNSVRTIRLSCGCENLRLTLARLRDWFVKILTSITDTALPRVDLKAAITGDLAQSNGHDFLFQAESVQNLDAEEGNARGLR